MDFLAFTALYIKKTINKEMIKMQTTLSVYICNYMCNANNCHCVSCK